MYNLFSSSCWGRTKAFKKHPPIILPVGLILKIVPLFLLQCLSLRDLSNLFKIHHTICRQGNSFQQMKWVRCKSQREKHHGQRDSRSNFADFALCTEPCNSSTHCAPFEVMQPFGLPLLVLSNKGEGDAAHKHNKAEELPVRWWLLLTWKYWQQLRM